MQYFVLTRKHSQLTDVSTPHISVDLGASSITSRHIEKASLRGEDLASSTITTRSITDLTGSVLASSSITDRTISDVSGAKIASSTITMRQLSGVAVLSPSAVTSLYIASSAVTVGHLGFVVWEKLADTTLSANSASLSFTLIQADYKAFKIDMQVMGITGTGKVGVTFNGDGGSNYKKQEMDGVTSSVSTASTTEAAAYAVPFDTSGFGHGTVEIGASSPTISKSISYRGGRPGSLNTGYGYWDNATSAITTITLTASANSFSAGSRFELYGMKVKP